MYGRATASACSAPGVCSLVPDGRRIYDEMPYQPGDYACIGGVWWARPPHEAFPAANLHHHAVQENADGSVTVLDSLLMELEDGRRFHGWLRDGAWEILDDSILEVP